MRPLIFSFISLSLAMAAETIPETPKVPVTETIHGVKITDPYRWLEDQDSPQTREWLNKQMAFTKSVLATYPGQEKIEKRLSELLRVDAVSIPSEHGGRYFYTRRPASASQSMLCMRRGANGPEEVLVDGNKLGSGLSASMSYISHDGKVMVYGIRHGGEDETTLRFMDVDTKAQFGDEMPRARYSGIELATDRKGFYYSTLTPKGPRLYFHTFGNKEPRLVFGEKYNDRYGIGTHTDDSGRYMLITVWMGSSGDKSEVYLLDLKKPGASPKVVVDDVSAGFTADIGGNEIFILTRWKAPNQRVMAAKLDDPSREKWREVIPESKWPIESMSLVNGKISLQYLENVTSKVRLYSTAGKLEREVALPGLGSASNIYGKWDSAEAFYTFQSFSSPSTIYSYQIASAKQAVWAKQSIPFAADQMEVEQVWYPSKDGTKIPMFLAHKKGLKLNGNNPVYLTGYGGFNISRLATFSATAAYWAEIGGVFALPNLRGGGEFGEVWHKAGMLEKKQNVYDDFIGAAEWLIANKYTKAEKIAISGGSNGGLLVGAVMTQRPELFGAVLCSIPLLDMVRYHKFKVARWWVPEYGSSEESDQFKFIYKYSPYHNVKVGEKYPAVMFISGDSDTRVDPLHARKMAALMQSASGSGKPVLLEYDTEGGHSAGQAIEKTIHKLAEELLFLHAQLEVTP